MSSLLSTAPYRGTRDFFPPEMSVRTQLFTKIFDVIETFGFQRYDGPVLEPTAIYEAKSGDEIVREQLYHLTDKGGRDLALRPEMTPTVARMIAANAASMPLPARWYSHVNCFRYERPQRGRVREHWQINVDIFGSESVDAEVELFELIHASFRALGAADDTWVLRVNDRQLLEGALEHFVKVPKERWPAVLLVLDRWEKLKPEEGAKALAELGLADDQAKRAAQLLTLELDALREVLPKEILEASRVYKIVNDKLTNAPLKFDPLIVRAFEYYTSTVFEVFDTSPVNRRSIFGGGRYDNLTSLFSSTRIPGVGFGWGDVTLFNFLEEHKLLPEADIAPDVYVGPLTPQTRTALRGVLQSLRAAGHRAVAALEDSNVSKDLKRASKMSARYMVILGDAELQRGAAVLKDLGSGEQKEVALAALPQAITPRR